jgi:hypothetical protein
MKLAIRIAAVQRRLKRMEEDHPLFLKRIEEYTSEQKILANQVFDRALQKLKDELAQLRSERDQES